MGERDNIEPPIKKIEKIILGNPVLIAITVFVLVTIIVIGISFKYYDSGFGKEVLFEAHGMLFDILIIGILILYLNILREKRVINQRYIEEIDDFRGWVSQEAAHRIAGNIRRLRRNGFKGSIDLSRCYLQDMDLREVNLVGSYLQKAHFNKAILMNANFQDALISDAYFRGAELEGAIFRGVGYTNIKFEGAKLGGADLRGAILNGSYFQKADLKNAKLDGAKLKNTEFQESSLQDANFKDAILDAANFQNARLKGVNFQDAYLAYADFWGAEDLNIKQLAKAKTLYEAKLDDELMKQVEKKYPHLLENPKKE